MTKKKQKRPLNTYIGGSRSNKKKTKRNVLGIRRRIIGGDDVFNSIWTAYQGINEILKETSKGGMMAKAVISAGRRFIVSALIVALRSKEAIEKFMKANEIKVPPEIEGVEFKPADKAFIMLFKTDNTSENDMKGAYDNCLNTENGVIKKLNDKFGEIIQKLKDKTSEISKEPKTAGNVFNTKIDEVKKEVSLFNMQGTKGILETVEKEINTEQETTTEAANTVEGEVSVVEDAGDAGEEGPEATAEATAETTTEAEPTAEPKKSFLSYFKKPTADTTTETTPAEPTKSFLSYFKKPTAEQPVEQPTAESDGGSRKKRKYHKRKYRKSSQRKK